MFSDQGEASELSDIHEVDWIPVPNHSYLLKYAFSDSKYHIIASNLAAVFEEEMTDADVEARFVKFNPHIKMKPRVILEHLKKSLVVVLSGGESNLCMKSENGRMIITLEFHACHAACKYDIEMTLMPAEKVMRYITVPTLLGSLLSHRKVLELQNSENRSKSSKNRSSAIDPEWLEGKNVPLQFAFDSFLSIQSHFKELRRENNEAFRQQQNAISSKKIKQENVAKAPAVIHHKKVKLSQKIKEESSLTFEEEEESTLIEEEKPNTKELSNIATKKKKERKLLKI